jgi:comEA protein
VSSRKDKGIPPHTAYIAALVLCTAAGVAGVFIGGARDRARQEMQVVEISTAPGTEYVTTVPDRGLLPSEEETADNVSADNVSTEEEPSETAPRTIDLPAMDLSDAVTAAQSEFELRRETTVAEGTVAAEAARDGPVNINTATAEELMTLKGIGEKKAQSIIEYRESHAFERIEDIMEVSGIGEKTFENIKDSICV